MVIKSWKPNHGPVVKYIRTYAIVRSGEPEQVVSWKMDKVRSTASIEDMASSGYADLSSHFTKTGAAVSSIYLPDGGSLHLNEFAGPLVSAKLDHEMLFEAQIEKGAGARSVGREQPMINIYTEALHDAGVRKAHQERLSLSRELRTPFRKICASSIIKKTEIAVEQAKSPALRVRFQL